MNFLKIIVQRPIAVAMLYLVIAAVGFNFLFKMPLQEVPTPDNVPKLDISLQWLGTNPETMEAFVTSPVEGVASTVKGAKNVTSTTREGSATVTVEFADNTDMKFAEIELKERLLILHEDLPPGVAQPSVNAAFVRTRNINLNAQQSLNYLLTGEFTLEYIRKYAEDHIQIPIGAVEGVGDVELQGGRERIVKVEINQDKAELFGVRVSQIRDAIQRNNLDMTAGFLNRDGKRHDIFIKNQAASVSEIKNYMIRNRDGQMIFLKDVATVTDDFAEATSYTRINGNAVVGVEVKQEEGANIVKFVEEVDAMVEELRQDFPNTLQMVRRNNPSQKVKKDIANIQTRAVFCILVIFLVLYLFLRNLKVPILILSTILFAELTTIILFYTFDISFNILTIAGLALGFGMLVDSAIVVIDNVFRYREQGKAALESALLGAKEVFLPLMASVTTTSIVFIPFLYLDKSNRVIFTPVALAVALSLLSSMVIAFTFIPTFAYKFLPKQNDAIQKNIKKNKLLLFLTGTYGRFIEFVVRNKYGTLTIVILLFAGSAFLFSKTVTQFAGWGGGSQSTQIGISVTMPDGAELERGDAIVKDFEDRILTSDYVKMLTARLSSQRNRYYDNTYVSLTVDFTEEAENVGYPFVLYDELTSFASTFAGVSISVRGMGDYFSAGGLGGSGSNFRIQILGYNFNRVGEIANSIGRTLERVPRVKNVETTSGNSWRGSNKYETTININREKLSTYNLNVQDVISEIRKYVRDASTSSRTIIDGEDVGYAVKVKGFESLQLEELKNAIFTTESGELVRIGQVTDIGTQKVLGSITRDNQQYERTLRFEYRGPSQMGAKIVERIKETTALPRGYSIRDQSNFFGIGNRERANLVLVIVLSVVLVFMMTASLYESLLHPFVVILTVPMAMIGVFMTFFWTGQNFNQSAYIGVILLAGIVVNNSIILVDHINLLRKRGMDLYSAVVQGCKDRVRPILMTSATTVMGLLPLILWADSNARSGYGGDNMWYTISLASIGGLLSATPLTLSVIPVLYILIEEWRNKFRKQWQNS